METIEISRIPTVLIVDNEEMVLKFLRQLLQKDGYDVLVARSGVRAIELAKLHEGPIHVLVCHWNLRDLDGPSVAGQIQAVRPTMKVVLMSASNPGLPVKDGWSLILKPFDHTEFLGKIRQLVSTSGSLAAGVE
jgi:DNA-binding response OmpR family regulator